MDFQRSIRKTYTERINSVSDNITIPSERLKLSIGKLDQSDIMESYFSNVLQNLKSCVNQNDSLSFERAAGLITGSKRKFIVTSLSLIHILTVIPLPQTDGWGHTDIALGYFPRGKIRQRKRHFLGQKLPFDFHNTPPFSLRIPASKPAVNPFEMPFFLFH